MRLPVILSGFLRSLLLAAALCSVSAGISWADTVKTLTQVKYDALNRPVCTAVRMNAATLNNASQPDPCTVGTAGSVGPDRISRKTYDAAGQLLKVENGLGTPDVQTYARYTYTANGQVDTQTDANGNTTNLDYDGFDRLTYMYFPSKTRGALVASTTDFEQYDHDANGNVVRLKKRGGQIVRTCYDALNRTAIAFAHDQSGCPATGQASDVYTRYDLAGHALSKTFVSASGAGVTYAYDHAGRMMSSTDSNGKTVGYLYNGDSARTRLTWPDSVYVTYGLDNLDRLTRLTHSNGAVLIGETYYHTGLRRKLLRGAAASASEDPASACTTSTNVTCYSYDNLGRLTAMTNDLAGAADDITWTFGAYTPSSQVSAWTVSSNAYDYKPAAKPLDSRSFNGLNQDAGIAVVSGGGFDANGNLIGDGARSMTYDVYNRLTGVDMLTTPSSPDVSLTYDAEGRLFKYTANGLVRYFLYDGTNVIADYDDSAAHVITNRYVFGTGVDEPLVWFVGSDTATERFFYDNYQGSIVATTNVSGTLADRYTYGPYGEPIGASGQPSWTGSPFRYTGQMMLGAAQLYHYKARVYDPAMGRFFQTDPVGSKDDLNLYAYTHGDPINGSDPTGQTTNIMFPSEADGGTLQSKHTAVLTDTSNGLHSDGVSMSGSPALYDPNGQQEMGSTEGVYRSDEMNNLYTGPGLSVGSYVSQQFSTYSNIDAVVVVNVPTTSSQEGQIINNAQNAGPGGFPNLIPDCTLKSSSAISGVGPIPNVANTLLPNSLRNTLVQQFGGTTYNRDGTTTTTLPRPPITSTGQTTRYGPYN